MNGRKAKKLRQEAREKAAYQRKLPGAPTNTTVMDMDDYQAVLTWGEAHTLLPASVKQVSAIESIMNLKWQDYLDEQLGWEHPNPLNRLPHLAKELNFHSAWAPQPEHEEFFKHIAAAEHLITLGDCSVLVRFVRFFSFDSATWAQPVWLMQAFIRGVADGRGKGLFVRTPHPQNDLTGILRPLGGTRGQHHVGI